MQRTFYICLSMCQIVYKATKTNGNRLRNAMSFVFKLGRDHAGSVCGIRSGNIALRDFEQRRSEGRWYVCVYTIHWRQI